MSGSSVRMYRAMLRTNSAPPKLVVVEAECLSPDERTVFHCYQVASPPFWSLARRKVNLPSNAKRTAARSIRLP